MGNLEKAGVLVVVVLLAVIMVVAFVSDPGDTTDPGRDREGQTASREGEQAPGTTAPGLQHQRRVDEGPGPGSRGDVVLGGDIVDVTPPSGEAPPPGGAALPPDRGEEPSRPVSSGPGPEVAGDAAAGPGLEKPSSAGPREIKVQPGDSLWKIAARTYGVRNADGMALEIQKENDISDPLALRQGMILALPALPSDLKTAPSPVSAQGSAGASHSAATPTGGLLPFDPGPAAPLATKKSAASPSGERAGTYVVRSGDTLGEIAVSTMGSAKFVKDIMELNEIADARKIRPGMVLNLPSRSR